MITTNRSHSFQPMEMSNRRVQLQLKTFRKNIEDIKEKLFLKTNLFLWFVLQCQYFQVQGHWKQCCQIRSISFQRQELEAFVLVFKFVHDYILLCNLFLWFVLKRQYFQVQGHRNIAARFVVYPFKDKNLKLLFLSLNLFMITSYCVFVLFTDKQTKKCPH